MRFVLAAMTTFFVGACADAQSDPARTDNAIRIELAATGSHQNPAWSPDGHELLLTRFRAAYNEEPADLLVTALDGTYRTLVADGSGNVNLPGSAWNAVRNAIVFSSSRDPHDEIYLIAEDGTNGDEVRVTNRPGLVAYEPTLSPDGEWVAFESHVLDVEGHGIITRCRADGSGSYVPLTLSGDDCRQPNWSPAGDLILYQRYASSRWDIWVMDPNGSNARQVTSGPGDKTDASFSPDGAWIVYSSDEGELDLANIFIVPTAGGTSIRVSRYDGYDGAPSWSPDGKWIAFESCPGDPDDSAGTTLWMIPVPPH